MVSQNFNYISRNLVKENIIIKMNITVTSHLPCVLECANIITHAPNLHHKVNNNIFLYFKHNLNQSIYLSISGTLTDITVHFPQTNDLNMVSKSGQDKPYTTVITHCCSVVLFISKDAIVKLQCNLAPTRPSAEAHAF